MRAISAFFTGFLYVFFIVFLYFFTNSTCVDSCKTPAESKFERAFYQINELKKHPDYALCSSDEYRSAHQDIVWEQFIKEKIKKDGKKVEVMRGDGSLHLKEPNVIEGAFITFSYLYRIDFKWFGLNKNNKHYAIGTLFLDDLSFSMHYYKLSYERIYIGSVSETQYSLHIYEDKEAYKAKEGVYYFMDRESGEMERTNYKDYEEMIENFEGEIEGYTPDYLNKDSYMENGVSYTVDSRCIKNENESIYCPTYEHVLERSEELREMHTIIGGAIDDDIEKFFTTNGLELFLCFTNKSVMFGYSCNLPAVFFRCDSSLETFEYIGIMYNSLGSYPYYVSIIKIN